MAKFLRKPIDYSNKFYQDLANMMIDDILLETVHLLNSIERYKLNKNVRLLEL